MGLADRITALARRSAGDVAVRSGIDTWLTDYLLPAVGQFGFGGSQYSYGLHTSYPRMSVHEIESTLPSHAAAVRASPPAFGAELVRALVLSQARFTFRNPPSHPRTPRRPFGTPALAVLEKPWPNATTGELISRMEWHAGLAGNSFVTNRTPGRLRVLRPDWVAIVYGSQQEPEMAAYALDGELLGYVYAPGGLVSTGTTLAPTAGARMYTLLPDEVAHWSPIPDPECAGIGMSWITPAVREIQGDIAAAQHKVQFFLNAATPNLVVRGIPAAKKEQFDEIVDMMEERHAGIRNAYKTLYLVAGADATVVGANMQQIDFKATVGVGETRISVLSRVPAPVLGISEGLAGSSLNAGNFGQARRNFADTWVFPSLQDLCAALAPLVAVPRDAELWFDPTDMPLLREDAKDAAEIYNLQVEGITKAVREGFTADSSVAAAVGQDPNLLVHTGLTSVQLQPPITEDAAPKPDGGGPPLVPAARSRSIDDGDQADALDESSMALLAALDMLGEFAGEPDDGARAWTAAQSAKHPRGPDGKFLRLADRIADALVKHINGDGKDNPLDDYNREQLRKVAKEIGLPLEKGMSRDAIVKLLIDHANKTLKGTAEPKLAPKKKHHLPSAVTKHASELKAGDQVMMDGKVWTVQAATPAIGGTAVSLALKDDSGAFTSGIAYSDEPIEMAKAAKAAAKTVKAKAPTPKPPVTPKAPTPPKPKPAPFYVVGHIPEPLRKKIFAAYKAQPQGQLLSSPAHHSYDNLVAIAHVHGNEAPDGFLTPAQIAEVVDEQLAASQHIGNTHLLENKIKKWLETADGKAYAIDHGAKPKPEIVARLTGKVVLPEGVTLKPGQRVQTLSGPGKYKPGETHFPKRTHTHVQEVQTGIDAAAGTTLTPGQVAALRNYTGGGYVGMNDYLRGGDLGDGAGLDDAHTPALVRQRVLDLQSTFVPWPEPMLLFRGTGWEQLPEGFRDEVSVHKLVGKTLPEPGFVSTSPVRVPSAFEGPVKLVIEAPAGTPGRYVEEFSVNSTEYEHVLAAGTKFRVISVTPSKEYPFKVEIRLRVVTPK